MSKEFDEWEKEIERVANKFNMLVKKIEDENSLIKINESITNRWDKNKYNTIRLNYDRIQFKLNRYYPNPNLYELEGKELKDIFQIIKEKLVDACKTMLSKSEDKFYEFNVYNLQHPIRGVVQRIEDVIMFLEKLFDLNTIS